MAVETRQQRLQGQAPFDAIDNLPTGDDQQCGHALDLILVGQIAPLVNVDAAHREPPLRHLLQHGLHGLARGAPCRRELDHFDVGRRRNHGGNEPRL